jgi:hypothetical protein
MGRECAASWVDDPDQSWQWRWRRIAGDSGAVIAESPHFRELEHCIEHAKQTASLRTASARSVDSLAA